MSAATVVEPVLDQAAAERARLVNAARAALLRSGTAVDFETIAGATGRDVAAVRQWVNRRVRAQRLVSVSQAGRTLVPTAQLSPAFELDDRTADLIELLVEHGLSGWAVWDWLETPNGWLDGEPPATALARGQAERVRHAIAGLFQE